MRNKRTIVLIPHGIQEHYSVGYANAVSRAGHVVDFVSSENINDALLDDAIRAVDLGLNKEKSRSLFKKIRMFVGYHFRLVLFVLGRRRAVIHVIGLLRHELVTGILEGLIFRLITRSYILTVHNIVPHDSNRVHKTRLYRIIYRLPNLLIVHTENMKSELVRDFGVEPHKIIHMIHGLNEEPPKATVGRADARRKLSIAADAKVALFFGKLAPYKGLDTLIAALEKIDDISLLIAGKADDPKFERDIVNTIASSPAASRIIANLGWVDNTDIPLYFASADVLVLPYRHIDQTGVLFLSLRYGVPILAFNVGSLKDYVTEHTGLILESSTSDALADGLNFIMDNRSQYPRDRIATYANRFRWEYVIRPVLNVYR